MREMQLASKFKLGSIEEIAGYVTYDTDQITFVAEKQLHEKFNTMSPK